MMLETKITSDAHRSWIFRIVPSTMCRQIQRVLTSNAHQKRPLLEVRFLVSHM